VTERDSGYLHCQVTDRDTVDLNGQVTA
jgi:hypothetical protein